MDLGTVLCWASNSIGRQSKPCSFHLIAARRPGPVDNCTVTDKSSIGFRVRCQHGFDGGMEQVHIT